MDHLKRYTELKDALKNAKVDVTQAPVFLFEGESTDGFNSYEARPRHGRMTLWANTCEVVYMPPSGKAVGKKFPYSDPAWAQEAVRFYLQSSN